jgi:hypothetical protein
MIDMLKRHEIQVLRRAAHTWSEIAALSGVSEKTARRIATENPVTTVDNEAERARRQVGRPSPGAKSPQAATHRILRQTSHGHVLGHSVRHQGLRPPGFTALRVREDAGLGEHEDAVEAPGRGHSGATD